VSGQNHKIAESLENLVRLVNSALNCSEFTRSQGHADLLLQANNAVSYLVNLFLCPKCQGSGEVYNKEYIKQHTGESLIECPDCQGIGVKTDILDRLEAEDITDEYHRQKNELIMQGCGDGQGHDTSE